MKNIRRIALIILTLFIASVAEALEVSASGGNIDDSRGNFNIDVQHKFESGLFIRGGYSRDKTTGDRVLGVEELGADGKAMTQDEREQKTGGNFS